MLYKFASSLFITLFLLSTVGILVTHIKTHLWDSQPQTFPLNQLERGFVSRSKALKQLAELLGHIKNHERDGHNFTCHHVQKQFAQQISSSIRALGLTTLGNKLAVLFHRKSETADISVTKNSNDSFTRYFVRHRLCYESTFTPQGNHRQVDPSFCPRLINLLNDIQQGRQQPLLTLFTWFPDPLFDTEKLQRRLLFDNWNLLRPIVQPVMVTDSRVNIAKANYFDWPCLTVPTYSSLGIPVFKSMTKSVISQFNSTFYGYVRPTTVFDASLVETLLKLKETYIDKQNGADWDGQTNHHSRSASKPILVYGRALRAGHVGHTNDLQHISHGLNATESHLWPDRKDSLVYLFYAGVDFQDSPDFIVHDKFLTSLLVSRSMALGHLVVDASSTICCVHIYRDKLMSEWDRFYMNEEPRDLHFNKRLGSQYFHSLGLRKPDKWLNEVATKFSRSGNIYIDVRSESLSVNH